MPQHQEFQPALERAIDLSRQLEQLLLDETALLHGREPERLQALIKSKLRLLRQVEQATRHLKALVEQAGQPFTREGLSQLLEALDTDPTQEDSLSAQWQTLRKLAASCELMNRNNAQTVEHSRKRVATALSIIRGEEDNGNTYNLSGHEQSGTVLGRPLTQA
ncbi:flagella synthesis protein FlgN [Rhabdochromatium marinum]|uniref:flagella synthesis protein FlgN n=1 Tax=Rhabdochromatium marinum TaxID=48729 RepID=UPI00190433AC|nr:flagellar protein FlgN [Rhabdochromatium marinum]MBK1647458.1 hypothetical protein [Rhabdochromatium marinum]